MTGVDKRFRSDGRMGVAVAPVSVKTGRYGPFVTRWWSCVQLPDDMAPEAPALEQTLELPGDAARIPAGMQSISITA